MGIWRHCGRREGNEYLARPSELERFVKTALVSPRVGDRRSLIAAGACFLFAALPLARPSVSDRCKSFISFCIRSLNAEGLAKTGE